MVNNKTRRLALFLALLSASIIRCASADADLFVKASRNDDNEVGAVHLGVRFPWHPDWEFLKSPRLDLAIEASLGHWVGRRSDLPASSLNDLSVVPVFRFYPDGRDAGVYFFEAGIGAHLLSRTAIDEGRRFSTALQFGDMVGVGWRPNPPSHWELGLRVEHVSNADIKKPNDGVTFYQLRVQAPL